MERLVSTGCESANAGSEVAAMVNAVRGERDFNLVTTASGARRLRATAGCFLALVDLFVKGTL